MIAVRSSKYIPVAIRAARRKAYEMCDTCEAEAHKISKNYPHGVEVHCCKCKADYILELITPEDEARSLNG